MGGGGSITLKTENYGSLCVYFVVQIPATAEMTMSLQVDLVLSDRASTNEA